MPIPWSQVLVHGPKVLDLATSLLNKRRFREPEAVDPEAEDTAQIAAIVQRLQALEDAGTAQAEVTKNMAEQIQGLAAGLSDLSGKIALAIWLAGSALAVAVVALIVAVVR